MERYHATSVLSPNHAGLGAGGAHAKALRSARFTSSWSRETMWARAVFSEGDAARPTTASQPPGAHDRLASITGQGWRGRISLERVLVDRDGPAIAGSRKRRVRCIGCSERFSAAVALGFPKTLPLNHGFSLSKQKADNASDNGVENRTDHHAAHSAEQHEDVGLTKQHPDH